MRHRLSHPARGYTHAEFCLPSGGRARYEFLLGSVVGLYTTKAVFVGWPTDHTTQALRHGPIHGPPDGGLSTMPPEWQAWKLRSLDNVEFGRNVTNWLIGFLKDGEKPANEVLKEAEKKFDNVGDRVLVAWSLPRGSRVSVSANGRWALRIER